MLLQLFTLVTVQAQDAGPPSLKKIRQQAEKLYGPDPDLFNGRKYNDTYRTTEGHPFFEVNSDLPSTLKIRGKVYRDQQLRFDIYNQLLVLDYTDFSGATGSIILRDERVDYFTLGKLLFKKFPDSDGELRFGQVIHEDVYSCIYFWDKMYMTELRDGKRYFSFSDQQRNAVIVRNGIALPYKNQKSFLKCFPREDRPVIKSFLKEEGIRVQRAGDPEMIFAIQHVNRLLVNEN